MSVWPVDTAEEIEIAEFDLLKPRLANLWDSIFPGDEEAYTSVIVPSLTLDPAELTKIAGIAFYEERLLFLLMRLRNPLARVVYVTSQPIHPMVLDYYLQFSVKTESVPAYLSKFEEGGGIVEEMIEAFEVRSPSVQLRINPRREVILASTHEQILGGPGGQVFLGCLFPADDDYRGQVQQIGMQVGHVLAEKGVIGRLSVDFLATRDGPAERWRITAIEINLRMGGTTHPMLALRFLTGGDFDHTTGLLRAADGRAKYYRASDNVESDRYRGLLPEDLIEIVTTNRLDFNHRTGTGVLFHMIGAVSQFGKFGMTAIGNDRDEAERLFARAIDVLDREVGGRNQ